MVSRHSDVTGLCSGTEVYRIPIFCARESMYEFSKSNWMPGVAPWNVGVSWGETGRHSGQLGADVCSTLAYARVGIARAKRCRCRCCSVSRSAQQVWQPHARDRKRCSLILVTDCTDPRRDPEVMDVGNTGRLSAGCEWCPYLACGVHVLRAE